MTTPESVRGAMTPEGQKMTKIDKWHQMNAVAKRMRDDADKALGRNSPSNDKHIAACRFVQLLSASFQPMEFHVDLSHGYFGNSSCSSNTSQAMGRYLAAAITAAMPQLLDQAVELAQRDARQAKRDAEAEAREVLAALDAPALAAKG